MLSGGAPRGSGNCAIRVIHCTLEEVSEVCWPCLVMLCWPCLVVPPGVQGTVPLGSYTVHWKR